MEVITCQEDAFTLGRSIIYGVAAAFALVAVLSAAEKADAKRGKALFSETCLPCHNVDNDARKMGPSLKGLFKKAKLENGQKVSPETVHAQIATGGKQMPHYFEGSQPLMSRQDLADLVAYLRTL